MPYTQEQYTRAKAAIAKGAIPPDKTAVVAQRIAEFEGKKPGMGNLRAMEGAGGSLEVKPEPAPEMPTLSEVGSGMDSYLSNSTSDTAQAIKAAMPYEEVERRQQAVNMTKKLSRDESLKTASKLKVFADPPEYTPPKPLPGMLGSVALAATNFPARYFEPTIKEFKEVLGGNNRVAEKIREQYPDVADLAELSDANLLHSDAYRAYADARWQRELAKAIKEKRGIIRTAYSDQDWMSGGKPAKPDSLDSLADVMDTTMAAGSAVLQGGTAGGWDTALTLDGATDLRDAGRGSRDRNPVASGIGEIYGALHPRSIGSKVAGGLGKLGAPTGLVGRGIKAGAIGAGTAVLDENMRAAADLAADAMDAEMSAAETLAHIRQNLPGVDPMTATIGGGLGVGGDVIGAGAQAWSRHMQNSDELRVPLKDYERAGGKVGPFMGPKISAKAIALRDEAEALGRDPAGHVAEKVKQPLARQRLLEQEEMNRGIASATDRAQARAEGREPAFDAANKIRAIAAQKPGATPASAAVKQRLNDFADRLAKEGELSADRLDSYIDEMDAEANIAGGRGEPKKDFIDASKFLRDMRDEFKFRDDVTAVDVPYTGQLAEVSPLEVLPRPSKEDIALHRRIIASVIVTPEEAKAVHRFSQGYDQSMRKMQRGVPDPEIAAGHVRGVAHVQEARESLPHLESYMSKVPPATEIPYVYRGIVVPKEQLEEILQSSVVHADPVGKAAVTSVSADPVVARSFVARNLEDGTEGIVFKLRHQSAVGTGQYASERMQVEKELLLRGNTPFRVTGRYRDATNPRQVIIEAEEIPLGEATTPNTPLPKQVGAVRDRYGNVKAVEDYSAEKLRQSRVKQYFEQSNERMGLPRELEAESALSDPYVSKGVFDPKTPQQVAESLPVKVKFDTNQDKAFVSALRGASKRNNFRSRDEIDSLASRSELESLGGRAGLNLGPKLRIVRELESAGELKNALKGALDGVSSRGNFGFDTLRRMGYRLIPTLESIGSGLPESTLQLSDINQAAKRLKQFLGQKKAPKVGADGIPEGDGSPIKVKPKNSGIIPDLKGVELRGGLPARAVGPARDDEESVPEFTREESDFWLKVIDKMAKERPK